MVDGFGRTKKKAQKKHPYPCFYLNRFHHIIILTQQPNVTRSEVGSLKSQVTSRRVETESQSIEDKETEKKHLV